ncbi:hypothetical protein PHYSODRAFT_261622 [Phytophthora sojae]|uniref:Uncharacterized protein n=1 Tax=Phytophthora sojae (strain P6497) TaxID=1094619 RepID=G4YF04_PHYSP|nr:hypothetical protein PHYSODRAFT_261622 [Phytophthora sojae]EGZ27587.1 hypothetical protein PHYSODRAFT_261622 [Phytophthora sojae]|eukprot:XP_009514862.1 hypothetical protein PHYSODRAFT_261622 [Phytophthora sojae]
MTAFLLASVYPSVVKNASNRYAWLRWVVTGNLQLSFCESKEMRQYTKLNHISVETLTAIMEAVTKAVEKMIADPQYPLLSLAPVMDEPDDQLIADGHLTDKKVPTFFAKLSAKTPLTAGLRQDTRWSSAFSMLKRYFMLHVTGKPPGRRVCLQAPAGDAFTLMDVRVLFGELLKSHPSFAKYLATDADIGHSAVFEQAVVKVLDAQAALLTDGEVAALEPFKRAQAPGEGMDCMTAGKEGFAVRTLKRRKLAAAPAMYELLEAIPPTSTWWRGCLASPALCCAMSATASPL